jgi:hypothetical protein
MGFGGFYGDPNVGGQFTRKAQLIIHCLAERFNSALGEISKQLETCGSIFFGSVLRYGPSGYHWYEDLVRFGYELNMALEIFLTSFCYFWLPTRKPCMEI